MFLVDLIITNSSRVTTKTIAAIPGRQYRTELVRVWWEVVGYGAVMVDGWW